MMVDIDAIPKLKLNVPTYYGGVPEALTEQLQLPEFGEPNVPVLVHSADGIRVLLGSHDFLDEKPDISIERRPNGWAIFLHPNAGDPCGYVYFRDDGRSFLIPEFGGGAIEVLDTNDEPPEVDEIPAPVPDVVAQRIDPDLTTE